MKIRRHSSSRMHHEAIKLEYLLQLVLRILEMSRVTSYLQLVVELSDWTSLAILSYYFR